MERQPGLGGVGPKIAALLRRAEARGARAELELAERLRVPPSQLRGRRTRTTYTHDADGRTVEATTSAAWLPTDRALLLALALVRAEEAAADCPGCHQPKATAWHFDNEGYFEPEDVATCWACTALGKGGHDDQGNPKPATYTGVKYLRDETTNPLPPPPPARP